MSEPSRTELDATLGKASPVWNDIIRYAESTYAPLTQTWKPSKTDFGRMCLLQQKKRTLLYLTPEKNAIRVAIILGERAFQLAMDSTLPDAIKQMFRDAKPYAEGRGIRFSVHTTSELPVVVRLLEIKTAPA